MDRGNERFFVITSPAHDIAQARSFCVWATSKSKSPILMDAWDRGKNHVYLFFREYDEREKRYKSYFSACAEITSSKSPSFRVQGLWLKDFWDDPFLIRFVHETKEVTAPKGVELGDCVPLPPNVGKSILAAYRSGGSHSEGGIGRFLTKRKECRDATDGGADKRPRMQ